MARKGENIYKRKDGRWEGRYGAGRLPDGRSRYRSVYGKTYREVKDKLLMKKREARLAGGKENTLPQGLTVRESVRLWMEENRTKWKESTLSTYRSIAEKHILPVIGRQAVSSFDEEAWRTYFDGLRGQACTVQGKKLSETYLHQIFILLSQIFHFLAKKYRCGRPELPPVTSSAKTQPHQPPEGRELKKLEEYLIKNAQEGDLTSLGVLLSGCSGIRIGELCALQWKDIDLEKGSILIRKTMQRIRTFSPGDGTDGIGEKDDSIEKDGIGKKTGTRVILTAPKSRNSIREIPLPGFLMELLKSSRKREEASEEGYVLKGRKKEYAEPRTLQYRFQAILKKLGIPGFNFHMLRHIFATNCISQGFDMKTLSELLGHSNVGTTMRIYVHSDMERKKMLMAGYKMAA